jgi:hypothetical protein
MRARCGGGAAPPAHAESSPVRSTGDTAAMAAWLRFAPTGVAATPASCARGAKGAEAAAAAAVALLPQAAAA